MWPSASGWSCRVKLRPIGGGQLVYIPRHLPGELDRRDLAIAEQFRGDNHAELARENGLSVQWVYRILKRVRAAEIERRQRRLFD
jgi:Mor family transcriptional regulator